MVKEDVINNPSHYAKESVTITIEPIQLCEQLDFCLGNAFKYLFRYRNKGNAIQDLKKAEYYLKRFLKNDKEYVGLEVSHVFSLDNFIFKTFVEHQEWLKDWDDLITIRENLEVILSWVQKEIRNLQCAENKTYWRGAVE